MPNYRKDLQGISPSADPQTAQTPTMTNRLDTDTAEPFNNDPETPVEPSQQQAANPSKSPELSQEFQDEMFAKMDADESTKNLPDEEKLRLAHLCQELNKPDPGAFYRDATAHSLDLAQIENAISNPGTKDPEMREFLQENGYDLDKHTATADKETDIKKKDPSREEEEKKEEDKDDPVIVGSVIGTAQTSSTSTHASVAPKATTEIGANASPLETNPLSTEPAANPNELPSSLGTKSERSAGLNALKTQRADLPPSASPTPSSRKSDLEP